MPPRTKTEMEKKIKELEDKQAELQKEINSLKQVNIKKSNKWKPEIDEIYCYVNSNGNIDWAYWYNDEVDNWRYLTNNVFKTEKEAEEYRKKIEIQTQFRNYVEEHNDELDWENDNQEKCYIYIHNNIIDIGCDWTCKTQGIIYASSEQILRDAIAEIGEENIKKYILEVE